MKTKSAIALSILLGFTGSASAATITWGSANNITGNAGTGIVVKNYQPNNNFTFSTTTGTADIYSAGNSVFALNFTGVSGDTWVNRVTFFESTPQATTFISADDGGLTQNGVTLDMTGWTGNQRIGGASLQGNSYGAAPGYTWDTLSYMRYANKNASLTLSGLTVGQQYAIQYWVQDSRNDGVSRTLTLDGQTTLDYNNGSICSPGVGQWAIGNFTADNTGFQTISIAANDWSEISLFQLRAIPEPSAALLGGLGMLALLRRRRS